AQLNCGTAADSRACSAQVEFSRAWLATKQAEASADDAARVALLRSAASGYRALLRQYPGHAASTDNLVLVLDQLGDGAGLTQLAETLRSVDATKAAYVARLAGDAGMKAGKTGDAFDRYSTAFELHQDAGALASMTRAFTAAADEARAARLLAAANRMLPVDSSASTQAFRAIAQFPDKFSEAVWDDAAIGWVETLSSERRLTPEIVAAEFDLERNSHFARLAQRLRDPKLGATNVRLDEGLFFQGPRGEDWWTRNAPRSQALALAGWSMGHAHLIANRPELAESTWQGALQYAPGPQTYSGALDGKRVVMLDLLTDLARIEVVNKSTLDPDGKKFAGIERMLFESKGMAYQGNDLAAIERHHTLLGKMYADLGRFGTSDSDYRSARFQLKNAIATAKRRGGSDGASPQPALEALLADGYRCALPKQDASCRPDVAEASKHYTNAAKGFLDLDALDQAKTAVDDLRVVSPAPSPQQLELEKTVETRKALQMTRVQSAATLKDAAATSTVKDAAVTATVKEAAATATVRDAAATTKQAQPAQVLEANPDLKAKEQTRVRGLSTQAVPVN
ncbi:MAG TPA: hypothetical protein VIZ30_11565, partial [Pseudomonadales bacterium]